TRHASQQTRVRPAAHNASRHEFSFWLVPPLRQQSRLGNNPGATRSYRQGALLSRSTIKLMTSDHLGTRIAAPFQPGELLLGTPGYTFGLGFAVRQGDGVAGVPGSAGEFMWGGYAGTYFWVDPKEEIVAVYMTQAPSPIRAYYRKMFK